MTKTGGCQKSEEKMVTKVGRSVGTVKSKMVEWLVGPTPGIARAEVNWKMEVWAITKRTAVKSYLESETDLLKKVHDQLRPQILVYGRPDPIILAEIAPLFLLKTVNGAVTVEDFEKWHCRKHFHM